MDKVFIAGMTNIEYVEAELDDPSSDLDIMASPQFHDIVRGCSRDSYWLLVWFERLKKEAKEEWKNDFEDIEQIVFKTKEWVEGRVPYIEIEATINGQLVGLIVIQEVALSDMSRKAGQLAD